MLPSGKTKLELQQLVEAYELAIVERERYARRYQKAEQERLRLKNEIVTILIGSQFDVSVELNETTIRSHHDESSTPALQVI